MFWGKVEGAQELTTRWTQVRAALRAGLRRGVSKGTSEGAAEARAKKRFTSRSGKLERSIRGYITGGRTSVGAVRDRALASAMPNVGGETRLEPNDGATYGEMIATAIAEDGKTDYASFVEGGTKGGTVIVPKKKPDGWLRWFNPVGSSNAVFAKRVIRGNTAPHPFMSFAYFKCERVMIREIEIGVAQAQAILDR